MRLLKQSSTAQPLLFLMVDSTDHITGKTGLSPTVTLSKNGGSFSSPSGAVTEIANGYYKVAGNATDTNTLGPLILHATATGADPVDVEFEVVSFDPQDSVRAGLTALPNAAAEASGGLVTNGTSTGQISVSGGRAKADVTYFNGAAGTFSSGRPDVNTTHVAGTAWASTTIGRYFESLEVGTVTDLSYMPMTNDFDTSGLSFTGANDYKGCILHFYSGINAGKTVTVLTSTYNSHAALYTNLTVTPALPSTPTNGDGFIIIPSSQMTPADVTRFGGTAGTFSSGRPEVNAVRLANQTITASGGVTFPAATLASTTNITAGTITTVTNLTNAPTSGDFTATMKTSIGTAVAASAVASVTGNVGGNVSGSVGSIASGGISSASFAAGAINAAAIAADAIGASELAADAVAEIADAVWDEVQSGHTTAGTFGKYLDAQVSTVGGGTPPTAAAIADAVWDEARSGHVTAGTFGEGVASVQGAVTGAVGSVTGNVGGNVTGSVGSLATQAKADVNAEVDTAIADVGLTTTITDRIDAAVSTRLATAGYTAPLDAAGTRTAIGLASANLDTQLSAIDDYIDTEVAAIKAKTDNLPASPAATSDIPSASTIATAVAAQVTTDHGSGSYVRNTEPLDAAGVRTAVGLASANLDTQLGTIDTVVDSILADTGTDGVVLSTATLQSIADTLLARNVSNVEGSAAEHTLATVILAMLESSRSGTTWTIKRTDGSTTHATKTLTVDANADPITGVT